MHIKFNGSPSNSCQDISVIIINATKKVRGSPKSLITEDFELQGALEAKSDQQGCLEYIFRAPWVAKANADISITKATPLALVQI